MSIFSDVKDTMATQLAALFTAASLTVTIKKYRTLDWTAATEDALLILSANSHGETAQLQDYVDVVVSTIVRYGNETEASAAETTLDDIDQVLINAYRSDGTHQKAAAKWRAVNFYQPSLRVPSPTGTEGYRYAENYLRFFV
jgi:hypothetical protein